jgi:hypothetical protein
MYSFEPRLNQAITLSDSVRRIVELDAFFAGPDVLPLIVLLIDSRSEGQFKRQYKS